MCSRKRNEKEFDWAKRFLLPAGCSPRAHTGFFQLLWLHSPKTCMSAWLVNLNWLQERVCMVVSLVCLCVAPWWIGNLSEAYPASHSVTAGTGSSSLTPLKRIKRVQKMDGWMSGSYVIIFHAVNVNSEMKRGDCWLCLHANIDISDQ